MKRIMVMGASSGVGKSTFAKRLGEIFDIPAYHLDAYYWKPGWVEATLDEFGASQRKIVQQDRWIIDGNYSSTFEIRAEQADTIIYLELPLRVCLYRVVKRWITNIGKTRPDIGEGCPEKLDWKFIKFICTTYYPRKKNKAKRFDRLQSVGAKKTIITLTSKKEIEEFLLNLKEEKVS